MGFEEISERAALYAQRIMELERQLGECSGAVQTMERQLDMLRVQATPDIAPGWVGIPSVEWEAIMGLNASYTHEETS